MLKELRMISWSGKDQRQAEDSGVEPVLIGATHD